MTTHPTTTIANARLLTMRGDLGGGVGVIERGWLRFEAGRIADLGEGDPPAPPDLDATGRVLMPAFVDCHTHACYAGDRVDEWTRRLAGASYLELLEAGGGIMSTVRAVRAATRHELADNLLQRLHQMLALGSATIEVKSGYGLRTEDELKMLGAIADAAARFPGRVVATACIGHALDPDVPAERFIARTIDQTLPAVTSAFPGVAVDAYCERGAWPLDACLRLFEKAADAGHPCRVHADQFTSLGMVERAIDRGFSSVDHLEASGGATLDALAASTTAGVVLPVCGLHVDGRYADAGRLAARGALLAIATNRNPGSAPGGSMPLAIALACRLGGPTPPTPHQALRAATAGGARVLGLHDTGHLSPGARADLLLLDCHDEAAVAFELGLSPVAMLWAAGVRIA